MEKKKKDKKGKKLNKIITVQKEIEKKNYFLKENGLTHEQATILFQKTPIEFIYYRVGRGGKRFAYVKVGYVKMVLNFVFGFNWDFTILSQEEKHGQIVTHGRLTIRPQKGVEIVKEQIGRADIKYYKNTTKMVDYGNDGKASVSDSLKKCASDVGVASDVYQNEEFIQTQTEVEVVDVEMPAFEVAKNMISQKNNPENLEAVKERIENNPDNFTEKEKKELIKMINDKIKNETS